MCTTPATCTEQPRRRAGTAPPLQPAHLHAAAGVGRGGHVDGAEAPHLLHHAVMRHTCARGTEGREGQVGAGQSRPGEAGQALCWRKARRHTTQHPPAACRTTSRCCMGSAGSPCSAAGAMTAGGWLMGAAAAGGWLGLARACAAGTTGSGSGSARTTLACALTGSVAAAAGAAAAAAAGRLSLAAPAENPGGTDGGCAVMRGDASCASACTVGGQNALGTAAACARALAAKQHPHPPHPQLGAQLGLHAAGGVGLRERHSELQIQLLAWGRAGDEGFLAVLKDAQKVMRARHACLRRLHGLPSQCGGRVCKVQAGCSQHPHGQPGKLGEAKAPAGALQAAQAWQQMRGERRAGNGWCSASAGCGREAALPAAWRCSARGKHPLPVERAFLPTATTA